MRTPPTPASLRRRLAAVGLDYLVVLAYVAVLVVVGVVVTSTTDVGAVLFGSPLIGELSGFILLTLPVTLYFALSEASADGATWGKRRMSLRVVTTDGQRLSIPRSLLRSGAKFLPWELAHAAIWQLTAEKADVFLPSLALAACYALVIANVATAVRHREHRALHDLVAGTQLVAATR